MLLPKLPKIQAYEMLIGMAIWAVLWFWIGFFLLSITSGWIFGSTLCSIITIAGLGFIVIAMAGPGANPEPRRGRY